MATMITEDCISCGACETECPNEAISVGEDRFIIDPALCTECVGFEDEQMCAAACPPEACLPDPDHVETEELLFERAKQIHADQANSLELSDATSHFRAA